MGNWLEIRLINLVKSQCLSSEQKSQTSLKCIDSLLKSTLSFTKITPEQVQLVLDIGFYINIPLAICIKSVTYLCHFHISKNNEPQKLLTRM